MYNCKPCRLLDKLQTLIIFPIFGRISFLDHYWLIFSISGQPRAYTSQPYMLQISDIGRSDRDLYHMSDNCFIISRKCRSEEKGGPFSIRPAIML